MFLHGNRKITKTVSCKILCFSWDPRQHFHMGRFSSLLTNPSRWANTGQCASWYVNLMIRIWNNFSKKLHLISYHTPPSLSLSELTNNEAGLNLNLYPPIIMPTYGKAIKIQSQQSGNAFKESADYIHNWKFQQLQILLFSGCTGSLNQMPHDHCLKIKLRCFQISFIQSNWKANVSVRKLRYCVQNGTRPLSQKVTVFGDSAPREGVPLKRDILCDSWKTRRRNWTTFPC